MSDEDTIHVCGSNQELWSIPFLLPNYRIGSCPYLDPGDVTCNIPARIHIFDPTTKMVSETIEYPSEFIESQYGLYWIYPAYRAETNDVFILTALAEVFKINLDEFDQCEKILEFNHRCFNNSRALAKRRLFIRGGQCYIVGYVPNQTDYRDDSYRFKLFVLNEKTKEAEEICISEPIKSLAWDSIPLSLNKSDDIVIVCDSDKYLKLLRFCIHTRDNDGFGSIQEIKLNDKDKLFDYTAETGQITLRDDIILLFEDVFHSNHRLINIINLETKTIRKSFIVSSNEKCIHPVLLHDRKKEHALVCGYMKLWIQKKLNWDAYPTPYITAIVVKYYSDEKVFFLENCDDKRIRYAVSSVDDILQQNVDFIDKGKRKLDFKVLDCFQDNAALEFQQTYLS